MASLYSALKRRRLAFSGTSGSAGLGMASGSTLAWGAVIVTVMSWEYSLSPSSVIDGGGVSQLMLAGRGPLEVLGTSGRYPTGVVDSRSLGVGTGRETLSQKLRLHRRVPWQLLREWSRSRRTPARLPCFPSADRTHREDELPKCP